MVAVRAGVAARRLDYADRLVDGWAVDVLTQQRIIAIILGDALDAVIGVFGHLAIDVLGDPPAPRELN